MRALARAEDGPLAVLLVRLGLLDDLDRSVRGNRDSREDGVRMQGHGDHEPVGGSGTDHTPLEWHDTGKKAEGADGERRPIGLARVRRYAPSGSTATSNTGTS